MKAILRISALFSLVLMISITGFSQGTCGMKFSPHPAPNPSSAPYYATYYIWDVNTQSIVETSSAQVVYDNLENDYQFVTTALTPTHTYRFVAYVWDSSGNGYYGTGSTATFTGAQYNFGGPSFKRNTDIVYL